MSVLEQIHALERDGLNVVEALAGDIAATPDLERIIQDLVANAGDELYTDLLFSITYKMFEPAEAKRLWHDILQHKAMVNKRLGRNVGIRASVLDYLANHRKIMQHARVISRVEMDQLLVFMNVDGLTGAYNHRYFQDRLKEEADRAVRHKRRLGLLMLDLDNLKMYNDTFGHLQGDVVLRQVAKLLRVCARGIDIVARYGGDEFAIILPDTDRDGLMVVARRIVARTANGQLAPEFQLQGTPLSLSIGAAVFPDHADTPQSLIDMADKALYESKRLGRNRLTAADELSQNGCPDP